MPTIARPIPPGGFYAGVRKRPGPKRKPVSERQLNPPPPVKNQNRPYTVRYKLRVLSYWHHTQIRSGPTTFRQPLRAEVSKRFKIPVTNLLRWKKGEQDLLNSLSTQRRTPVSIRPWAEMEVQLYSKFIERRGKGKAVRIGWFRRNSKELWTSIYLGPAEGLDTPTTRGSVAGENLKVFCFSNGWFRGFLYWHNISLRFSTNKASQLPIDYEESILNWIKYNRYNSKIRPDNELGLGDTSEVAGRYRLSNICNMDQTPLPFEYLSGQTYNTTGEKTIWIKGSKQSSWDKRQATVQLTVFADGVARVKPLIFYRELGVGAGVIEEMKEYDSRVVVKFNPTTYANSENIIQWLDEQVIPVLDEQPTLMVLDLFGGHKTDDVLDTLLAHDITLSLIPGGCTGLIQPLDVSINRPFKDILKVSS